MFSFRPKIRITTDRLILRPPMHLDFKNWKEVRHLSRDFLTPWEPKWAEDHLTRKSFSNRVYWSRRAINQGTGLPLLLFDNELDLDLAPSPAACLLSLSLRSESS